MFSCNSTNTNGTRVAPRYKRRVINGKPICFKKGPKPDDHNICQLLWIISINHAIIRHTATQHTCTVVIRRMRITRPSHTPQLELQTPLPRACTRNPVCLSTMPVKQSIHFASVTHRNSAKSAVRVNSSATDVNINNRDRRELSHVDFKEGVAKSAEVNQES